MTYVDVPTSSRHTLIRLASGLPWPGGEEAVGGGILLEDETNGFAVDFTHAVDAERVAVKTADVVVSSGLDAFFQNAGTSPKQVFDVSGNLVWSPHNLCLQSDDISTTWTNTNTTETVNAITVGGQAFDKIHVNTTAGLHLITQSLAAVVVGETYTFSCKAVPGEYVWLALAAETTAAAYLQLSGAGTVGTVSGTATGATITALGSGVYQCTMTWTATSTGAVPKIYLATGNGVVSFAGANTTDGLYVANLQVNRGAVPTAYLPTTTAARYGLAIDYDPVTHALQGLLSEVAGTNLLLNNTTLSTQSVTVTAVAHTLSFWGTGTITLSGVSTAGPLVGTGASNRVSLTFTPTAGSLTCTVTGTVSKAQLETGIVATSPIPTFGTTQTRAPDQYAFPVASIPWSETAGSFFVDFVEYSLDGVTSAFRCFASTGDNLTAGYNHQLGIERRGLVIAQILNISGVGAYTSGQRVAVSYAFDASGQAGSDNGTASTTSATSGVAATARLTMAVGCRARNAHDSQPIGHIKKLVYVPRRVDNATLPTWKYTP